MCIFEYSWMRTLLCCKQLYTYLLFLLILQHIIYMYYWQIHVLYCLLRSSKERKWIPVISKKAFKRIFSLWIILLYVCLTWNGFIRTIWDCNISIMEWVVSKKLSYHVVKFVFDVSIKLYCPRSLICRNNSFE